LAGSSVVYLLLCIFLISSENLHTPKSKLAMASQQDLQELLRLLTVGKVPIKDAMMRVKALQAKNLRTYAAL
jgi:hypothetical protein